MDCTREVINSPEYMEAKDRKYSCFTLHGTTDLTDLNGMINPKPNWLPSAEDEEMTFRNRSRSSSCDSEEIVFRGRARDLDAINIVRVSREFKKLSVAEERDEIEGKGCSLGIEVLDLLDDDDSSGNQDEEGICPSEDVRQRISPNFWISYWEELKVKQLDPYPDIDLNRGWNRHVYRGLREYFHNINPSTPNTTILSDFAAFSLRAQQLLIPVRPNLAQLFYYVFNSTGPVKTPFHTCRSRVLHPPRPNFPATMTGSRKLSPHIAPDDVLTSSHEMCYTEARTIYLFDCAPATIRNICLWLSHGSRGQSKEKRPRAPEESTSSARTCWPEKRRCFSLSGHHVDPDMVDSRPQHCGDRHCHERVVWDDQWRKRMRYRAVTGGRWTDGSLRQDQMWAAFHWVLDGDIHDDPTNQNRAFEEVIYG